jgi:hypothetical protein
VTYPNIALLGRMGTGKTTIALALSQFGYNRFSWAKPVREVASLAYGQPIRKDGIYEVTLQGGPTTITGRQLLQRLGTDAIRNEVDEDFWIKVGLAQLDTDPDGRWVNDDLRFPNEAAALIRRNWILVRVILPEDERLRRISDQYGERPDLIINHESERWADEIPVHVRLWNTAEPYIVAQTLLQTIANATIFERTA